MSRMMMLRIVRMSQDEDDYAEDKEDDKVEDDDVDTEKQDDVEEDEGKDHNVQKTRWRFMVLMMMRSRGGRQ